MGEVRWDVPPGIASFPSVDLTLGMPLSIFFTNVPLSGLALCGRHPPAGKAQELPRNLVVKPQSFLLPERRSS